MTTTIELDKTLIAETALAQKLEAFGGQYVAVRSYEVVCAADTLNSLIDQVELETVDVILEVPEEPARACLF